MNADLDSIEFTTEQLHTRVAELGKALTARYAGKEPILLCVLKGSVVFTADLMRAMEIPCTLECVTLSSYGAKSESSGVVELVHPFDVDVKGRDVIVVEDILDTGRTLSFMMDLISKEGPASLTLVVLLDKPSRRVADIHADLVGFTVPDVFLVGYGLDYNQKYRNLPYIGVLDPKIYARE